MLKKQITKKVLTIGALLLPAVMMAVASGAVFADEPATAGATLDFDVKPFLEFQGLPSILSVDVQDFTVGQLVASGVEFSASTNNPTGYTMTFAASTDTTDLVSRRGGSIPTLTSDTTSSNFPMNHWGFSLDGDNYSPIPLAESAYLDELTTAGSKDYIFHVGAKVDASVPDGVYSGMVTFSIVANAVPFTPPETMQEMTPEICAEWPMEESYQLKDTRDNKLYWVTKLADNDCWMTQNLALGDTTKTYELDSTNSDLASGQTFTMPTAQTSGTGSWSSCSSDSACQTARVYATNNDSYGNYYSWYTATANTGTYSMSSGEASGSICPKGWKLPTTNGYTFDNTNQFYKLMSNYVSGGSWSSTYWKNVPTTNFIGANTGVSLVFSGYYISGVGDQGRYGYWWSRSINSSTRAYSLNVGSSGYVYPANDNTKYAGYSVRCVAVP